MSRPEAESAEATLRRARLIFVASIASVLLVLAATGWIRPLGKLSGLTLPISLLGLVSPVIGYRLYLFLRERTPPSADRAERCRGFLRAGIVGLAVTEGAAMLGVVGYILSGELSTLAGVLTHVLLVGAIWPTPERLQSFLELPDGRR